MNFKHISEVWEYLLNATDYDDLLDRIENIPSKFGSWDVEPNEYHCARIINTYTDSYGNWDQELEDTDIECPDFGDEE